MTALDVSSLVADAPVDSPELAAFKEKVKTVAKAYAKRNGWCSEVDRALREIGVTPPPERRVMVHTTAFGAIPIRQLLLPSALHGKSEDEQKTLFIDAVGGVLSVAAGAATNSVRLTVETLGELTMDAPSTPEGSEEAPAGYRWRRKTGAKVAHLFPEVMSTYWTDALCNKVSVRNEVDFHDVTGTACCVRCSERGAARAVQR